jgi:hypothetical protein
MAQLGLSSQIKGKKNVASKILLRCSHARRRVPIFYKFSPLDIQVEGINCR